MDKEKIKKFIQDILRQSDLSTVSAKIVRGKLQSKVDPGILSNRVYIDGLIMEVFEDMNNNSKDKNDGGASDDDDGDSSDSSVISEPSIKKRKSINIPKSSTNKASTSKQSNKVSKEFHSHVENAENLKDANNSSEGESLTDEALARKLHAEELSSRQPRRSVVKVVKNKKRSKPSDSGEKKPRKNSAFGRTCILSNDLRAYLGEGDFSLPELTKRMWAIAKENNMFDPKNKQFVICNEDWHSLFKVKRIRMFGITKHLKKHAKWIANDS